MNSGRSKVCPVCGNYKINGVCWRCRANERSRKKGWRRGDKGGVRPERKKINNSPEQKSSNKPRVRRRVRTRIPPAKQTKNQSANTNKTNNNTTNPIKPSGHTFYSSLKGIWYSDREDIRIFIDLQREKWFFTLPDGTNLVQIWKIKSTKPYELRFTRKRKEIIARIDDQGRLLLTGKDQPVPFIFLRANKKYRLCKICNIKSEWNLKQCRNCSRKFSSE